MVCLSRDTALFRKGCGLVRDQPQLLGLYFSPCGAPSLVDEAAEQAGSN
jgi:hypothetical protein